MQCCLIKFEKQAPTLCSVVSCKWGQNVFFSHFCRMQYYANAHPGNSTQIEAFETRHIPVHSDLESRDLLVTVATAGGEDRAVQSITLSISHRKPATTKLFRGRKDGILKAHVLLKLYPAPWACRPYLWSSPRPITKGEISDASLVDNYVYIVVSKFDYSLFSRVYRARNLLDGQRWYCCFNFLQV